jgi:hypothetical protein
MTHDPCFFVCHVYRGNARFSLRMRRVSAIAFVFTTNLNILVFPDATMQIEINENYHYRGFIYYELYVTVRGELRQAKKQLEGKHESSNTKFIEVNKLSEIQEIVERYRKFCNSPQSDDRGIERHGIRHWILKCWSPDNLAWPFMVKHWPGGPTKYVSRQVIARAKLERLIFANGRQAGS